MSNPLMAQAESLADELRQWRRHLHRNPELSGHEKNTAAFVAEKLRAFGYQPIENVNGTHGVMAELRAEGATRFLALRADIDALPITELNEHEYASTNSGVMHACGHDAHATMLLGAAKILRQRQAELKRNIRFVFQPHEEQFPGGAPDMIAGGCLEDADAIFGIHISSNLPTGKVGTRPGPFMAAVNPLEIRIRGKGGHAAMPDQCVDAVVIAAHVIVALQTVVSRNIPITAPAVVSVTKLEGGTADNVLPDEVILTGTVRTLDDKTREQVCRRVREVAAGAASALGGSAEVCLDPGYPVLVNDERVTRDAIEQARRIGFADADIQNLDPIGGGEDFAYYGREVPSAFVFLGAANSAKGCVYPHHHARFDIDEDALPSGVALHAQVALACD